LENFSANKSVTAIEASEDKLTVTRRGDFITLGSKFLRFNKRRRRLA
jgi:hypothetical protein